MTYIHDKDKAANTLNINDDGSINTVSSTGGTASSNVTVTNSAGTAAVNIQDGGNIITVDGTVILSDSTADIGVVSISGGAVTVLSGTAANFLNTEVNSSAILTTTGQVAVTSSANTINTASIVVTSSANTVNTASIVVTSSANTVNTASIVVTSSANTLNTASITVTSSANTVNTSAINGKMTTCDTGAVVIADGTADIGNVVVAGDVANDAADSGNPVKIGGHGRYTPSLVGSGDRVDAWYDPYGTTMVALCGYAGGATNLVTVVSGAVYMTGQQPHDAVDAGNPVKAGLKAIAHGTNPTAVAAADITNWYGNRAGIPFVMGGHPNIKTIRANYTTAQTNAAIVTIAASMKIVVTRCSVMADNANTVDVQVRIGFATATTPTTTGVVLSHPGIAPGSGLVEGGGSGMLGVGADNEDLRITSQVPTGGSIDVVISYYEIES